MIRIFPGLLSLLIVVTPVLSGCQSNPAMPDSVTLDKRVESHYRLGIDALNKGLLPKAFDELLHAEQLDPKRGDVLDALGYAWRLRGDLKKSEAYYKRALELNPSARTHNNYGTLLLVLHKPKKAEVSFRKALDDPRYNRPDFAYINLGDALLMQDRLADAIAAYRQARVLNPRQELSRLREAAVYLKEKKPDFARAMYETILRDSPGNRAALEGLLPLLRNSGDMDAARQQLQRFIKLGGEPLDRAWATERLRGLD